MEHIVSLFGSPPSLGGVFQIGMDVVILVMLVVLIMGRRGKISPRDEAIIDSFEKIIEETGAISREFESNLSKRQELILDITARLDQSIREAQDLCIRLERLERAGAENLQVFSAAAATPPVNRLSGKTDQQKVLFLAKKGLNASEIAKSLKKPLGEVELILNLQKIAS